MLFKGSSVRDRGTLAQLKNDFNHRAVTTDVMNSFNACDNFIRFVTEAHVVYLILKLCDMEELTSTPKGSNPHGSKMERKSYLDDIARMVVDAIWLLPDAAQNKKVIEADVDGHQEDWCVCDEGIYD